VVFIKFKKDAKKEDLDYFIDELNKLPERNREVKNWITGFSPEPRFHNADFDYALGCDLADYDAMERYMYHEAHVTMGPILKPVAEYWLSFDFNIDYVQPKRFPARPKQAKPRKPRVPKGNAIVPWVRGRRLEDARRILEEAGLTVGAIKEAIGGVWAVGRVTAQEPDKDSIVDKGTAVNLTISGEFWMKPRLP